MYAVLVREEYTRRLEVYNRPGMAGEHEAGWESASLPAFLGIYPEESKADALLAAAGDHGIDLDALLAIEITFTKGEKYGTKQEYIQIDDSPVLRQLI